MRTWGGEQLRTTILLADGWKFSKAAENAALAVEAAGEEVTVPHTWNAVDGQDGGNDYYRGTCWYVTKLGPITLGEGERVYLSFDGAAMTTEAYLNGTKVGEHKGRVFHIPV